MAKQNWKALQKKNLEKAEKGDNQHRGKKNNQDLETTRRSYATRRLKSNSILSFFKIPKESADVFEI